jgi:TPR repeat protein
MYATGRGLPANAVQAAKWHIIAKAGGTSDPFLEDFMGKMKPEDRKSAEDRQALARSHSGQAALMDLPP